MAMEANRTEEALAVDGRAEARRPRYRSAALWLALSVADVLLAGILAAIPIMWSGAWITLIARRAPQAKIESIARWAKGACALVAAAGFVMTAYAAQIMYGRLI